MNGVLVNTVTNNSTWSGTGNLMLGNIGGYTNVILDEVRFWDRALTQDEILNNYKKPLIGNENGLKLYYNFNNQGNPSENNTNITYLKDLTSNNNKGTFNNLSLSSTQNNFAPSIVNYDSIAISLDANNLDSYPGTGYVSSPISGGYTWYDLSTKQSLNFFNNLSYNSNAAPILNADGGRSLYIKNMYGRSSLNTGISGNSPKSIEAWVKFNSLDNISVVSIGNLSDYNQFELAANNNKLILNIGSNFSSNLAIKSISTLTTNKWYHVVITWSRNFAKTANYKYGTFTMYINGLKDNDYFNRDGEYNHNIDITLVNSTSTPVYIGTSLRPFNGKLGILKVYRKELLEIEVLNRFNATKSRFGY